MLLMEPSELDAATGLNVHSQLGLDKRYPGENSA